MKKPLETVINGIKVWTERLVKRSADEVRGEIPTPKQADWNQNDDTAIDHIKNRTHYERIGFTKLPLGTYNDHAPTWTDYNVGPYAWDYTKGVTLRVDGVVYEFETFQKQNFDSYFGCSGYWVGAKFSNGSITDSSEYPFYFVIFEKDNEYAHVEFADGTDNHTFEIFDTEIKRIEDKYIPDSVARKSEVPTRTTIVNYQTITFEETDGKLTPYYYDFTDRVKEIPTLTSGDIYVVTFNHVAYECYVRNTGITNTKDHIGNGKLLGELAEIFQPNVPFCIVATATSFGVYCETAGKASIMIQKVNNLT